MDCHKAIDDTDDDELLTLEMELDFELRLELAGFELDNELAIELEGLRKMEGYRPESEIASYVPLKIWDIE